MKITPIRTKAQVRTWLNARVGTRVKDKSVFIVDGKVVNLDGQCVALIKALLEYLGVPNAYVARGNARDFGESLVNAGIAKRGRGWLTIAVNPDMGFLVQGGGKSGHIWIDLRDEANYESNGAKALITTKGTRPYSAAKSVYNLDAWIKADPKPKPTPAKPAEPKRVAKSGKAKVTYSPGVNIRATPGGKIVNSYKKGATFNYDSYIDKGGIRWLSYVAYGGDRVYVAQKQGKTTYVSGGVK